jgi:hypothetical protein
MSGVDSRDRLIGGESVAPSVLSKERFRFERVEILFSPTASRLVCLSCCRTGRSPLSLSEGGDCAVTVKTVSSDHMNVGVSHAAERV